MLTTLLDIRQEVARKLYAGNVPIISETTSDSNSNTTLIDNKLGTREPEDFMHAFILVSEQAVKHDSGTDVNENPFAAGDTTLTVDDGGKFLAGDGIQIDDEILRVVSVATHNLLVVRGEQGTDDVEHADDSDIYIIGPPVGEVAKITKFLWNANRLTLAPALRASLLSGTEYEVHYHFHPKSLDDKINEILGNVRHPIFLPLTLVPDGDMEDNPATNFTGASCTLANDTTTVLYGRQSLKATAILTGGFVYITMLTVPPGSEVLVSSDVYITDGDSAKLTLIDVTNSNAVIETAESDITGWVHFEFVASIPATCESIQLRIQPQTSGDVIYINNLVLLPTQQKIYEYPSMLEWSEDFEGVFYFPKGNAIGGDNDDNAYHVLENASQPWSHATILRDETAVVPLRLQLDKIPIIAPLFVRGMIDFESLSSNTATTSMPKDIAIDLVYADMMDAWSCEDLNADRIELSRQKADKAAQIRYMLVPRMRHFHTDKGRVQGAMR